MKIMIDGVVITPRIAEVLKAWYEGDAECTPSVYVEYLNEIQDYLCCALLEPVYLTEESLKKSLTNVISIKNCMKDLIRE